MPQSRRSFLLALGAGAAALACGRRTEAAPPAEGTADDGGTGARSPVGALGPLGIQLYTVRAAMQRDMEGTLAALAAIGYREVEFAGYFGRGPAEVRAMLERHGLAAPSTHLSYGALAPERLPAALAEARAIGHRWITIPWLDQQQRTSDGYRELAGRLTSAGRAAQEAGLRVAYHNHDFELQPLPDGTVPLALLLRETDPALVDFELDVYWLVKAGGDPLDWFARHPGRFAMLHLKDSAGAPAHAMVDVGGGTIDWRRVMGAREQAGVRHLFVEHDAPADPMASARASHAYLAALRP